MKNNNVLVLLFVIVIFSCGKKSTPAQNGYSDSVWGLTAGDIKNGYTASSPTNDQGFIAPTAALSSFPYTPAESMTALAYIFFACCCKVACYFF